MKEVEKFGWWVSGAGWPREDAPQDPKRANPEPAVKTVMVYWVNRTNSVREPIGILVERRKRERENEDNVVGMLRLARRTFARTEEESSRITIGDYV
jgi:hypothetical protein